MYRDHFQIWSSKLPWQNKATSAILKLVVVSDTSTVDPLLLNMYLDYLHFNILPSWSMIKITSLSSLISNSSVGTTSPPIANWQMCGPIGTPTVSDSYNPSSSFQWSFTEPAYKFKIDTHLGHISNSCKNSCNIRSTGVSEQAVYYLSSAGYVIIMLPVTVLKGHYHSWSWSDQKYNREN